MHANSTMLTDPYFFQTDNTSKPDKKGKILLVKYIYKFNNNQVV